MVYSNEDIYKIQLHNKSDYETPQYMTLQCLGNFSSESVDKSSSSSAVSKVTNQPTNAPIESENEVDRDIDREVDDDNEFNDQFNKSSGSNMDTA
mmetsp:Transcript_14331/g.12966  ORF Transcript_14331/g.12966 Transcript_14331/m.12966 type:complete len:95 (+) Transcript_14331:1234-1518(+)